MDLRRLTGFVSPGRVPDELQALDESLPEPVQAIAARVGADLGSTLSIMAAQRPACLS